MKLMKKSVYLFLAFLTLLFIFVPSTMAYTYKEVIFIDPGHGGFDGGCVGDNSVEKDITLSIAIKLKNYLENVGYNIRLTREKDIALAESKTKDMHKRVALINSANTILYISIHANYFPDRKVKGGQVFYKDSADNLLLSKIIQKYLNLSNIGNNRKAKIIIDKYITDNIKHPGCLVEVGFLSNMEEEKNLLNEFYQNKVAYSIYLGILEYLET